MSLTSQLTTKLKFKKLRHLLWLVVAVNFLLLPSVAKATLYSPGATLEPDCPPTESSSTCGVIAPAEAGANTNITSLGGLTTALSAGQGGTGISTYTLGDLLYALNSSSFTKLGIGSNGQVLKVSGGVPIWGTSANANLGDTDLTLSGARVLSFGGNSLTFDGTTGDIIFSDNGSATIGGSLAVTATTTLTGDFSTPKGSDYSTTGSQNNVYLGSGSLFRYTGGSSATFTGLAGGADGKQIRIMNVSGSSLILSNESASSVAANRIITTSGSDLTVPNNISVGLQYDSGASRWRVVVLPATSGTINGFAYIQGGNAFGTTASLGTTDANGLNFITSGNTRFSLAAGAATFTGTGATTLTTDAGSALTLDSGTTGALNLGTGSNAKTITIGNTTGATALNLNAGTAGITLTGSTTLQNFTATNSTTTNATTTNLAVTNNAQLGTVTSGLWNGTTIGATYGGTGQTSWTTGDILYASGANTLSKLPIGTAGQILNVAGGVPAWAASPYATVSGKWATTTDNLATYTTTSGQVVLVGRSSTTTTGNILEVEGNSLFTGNANITGNVQLGTITSGLWNGTAIGPTYGGTNQTSYTTGDILYASGVNTLSKLPIGGSGTVLTTVGGVPTWAAPTGGSGATINGKWATSTDSLITYTISPIEAVVVGASATTSLGHSLNAKLEVVGNTLFGGNVNTTGLTTFSGGFISSASSTASSLNVSGMLGASTTLQSTGAARFYSTGQFDNTLTAAGSGTGLAVNNNATVGGTLGVTGLTTLGNASTTLLSASGGLFVGGNATTSSNGNFSTAGTITAAGLITASNGFTLSSGSLTLPSTSIADSALSANVGLLSGTQTFTGAKTFSALTTLGNASTTQLSASGALYVAGNLITPKGTDYATTGTQNDVNLGTGSLFRYTGGGTATFTGIAGGTDGRQIRIMNVSGSNLVLNNQDTNSLAANRIITSSGANLTIPDAVSVGLQYDGGSSRWRVVVLPATSGTIGGFAYIQGGNAYGTTASLGTTDANGLNFLTSGNTRFSLAAGAATLTGTGATSLVGGSTLALSSAAGSDLSLTSGTTGALGLDSGSTGAINIGTGASAKTITIGNGTGATSLVLNAGTGNIDIGANAIARTINVGTGAAVVETINVGGTGANIISIGNSQTGGSLSLGTAMTTGTVSIGGTGAHTGNFDLAPGSAAQTVTLANGSGVKTLNIGSGVSGNTISIGNGANSSAQIINLGAGAAGANSTINILSGVATAGTQTLNLGTGASAKTVTIGNNTGATSLTLNSGTGGITLLTGTTGTVSIKSGTTGSVTLDSGTTGAVNIGTGNNNKTINIGSGTAGNTINIGSDNTTADTLTISSALDTMTIGAGTLNITNTGSQLNGSTVLCINTKRVRIGASTTSCNSSSARFKHDINNLDLGLEAINNLRPVSYYYNEGTTALQNGLIAEEVYSAIPEAVVLDAEGLPYALDYNQITPVIVKAIQEQAVLLGDVSSKVTATSTDNGLTTLITTIQVEAAHDPVAIITAKINENKQFLTDFVAARVTAIRGYFEELFTKKIHTEELCVKKSDGNEVCVNGDQLQTILTAPGVPASTITTSSEAVSPVPEPAPTPEPTAEPAPVVEPAPEPAPEPTPEAVTSAPVVETASPPAEPAI